MQKREIKMSQDATTPSNARLDEIILKSSGNAGEMHELLRQYNLEQSARGAQAPPPSVMPQPQSQEPQRLTAFRVIYPHDQSRFELVGIDEADLDRQEAQIRAMYAKRK
jgi:hypothetical protein